MPQLLPVTSAPNQTMQAVLTVNGNSLVLNLSLYYNSAAGFWAMDVADQFSNPLVTSIPLLTGVWPAANIMAPFDSLQIGSWYLINQNGALTDWPDDTNLGSGFSLLVDDNPSYTATLAA